MLQQISNPPKLPWQVEERLTRGARNAARFFVGQSDVHQALERLAERLEDLGIPYVIVGAMALNAYGYERTTQDVNVLLRSEGLESFKKAWLGRGYVEKFAGSKGLRDAQANVGIDVLLTGDYPGDGLEKPVVFPDPEKIAIRGERYALPPLALLMELKLASGMTAPHRLRDLADVIELIRINRLGEDDAKALHPWVREKYLELWRAAQGGDEE